MQTYMYNIFKVYVDTVITGFIKRIYEYTTNLRQNFSRAN